MSDWNPKLYLKFKNERTQPSIDLVYKIKLEPKTIIDIGCGPGNSTQVLLERWSKATIVGMDNSQSMIEKARMDYPNQTWVLGDASKLDMKNQYDLVFSNATIQWIPDHEKLIPNFFNLVSNNGALAIQVPLFNQMPLNNAIERATNYPQWKDYTKGCTELFTYHDAEYYYGILSKFTKNIELWETSYIHILESAQSLMDFCRSTGLKPYLERLPTDNYRKLFENDVLSESLKEYKIQQNGTVLFPFKRLFFIAYKT